MNGPDPEPDPWAVPVFGRPSAAARAQVPLRDEGTAEDGAVRADGGDLPWGALRAATVTGTAHRLAGRGSDDAYAWAVGTGPQAGLALAVADGVGTRDRSGQVARAAAGVACRAAAGGATVVEALRAAGSVAADVVAPPDVLAPPDVPEPADGGGGATTLVVAWVSPDGEVDVARVGDSTAFVLAGGAWQELFDRPQTNGDDDDLVVTATHALPAADPVIEEAEATLGDGDALILVTDGVAGPLADGPTTVAPGLADALELPVSPLQLAALAGFSRQGCADDRTIVALWFRAAPDEQGSDAIEEY